MRSEDTQPLALPFEAKSAEAGSEVVPAEQVHQGELVTEAESTELERRWDRFAVTARRLPHSVPAQRAAGAGRAALRHGRYLRLGAEQAAARWRDAHGSARFERQIRAAEAAGEHDRLADWQTRAEQAKQARRERRQGWAEVPLRVVKMIAGGFAAALLALTLLGVLLAAAYQDITTFTGPFTTTFTVIRVLVTVLAVTWLPALALAMVCGVGWLWRRGQAADPGAGWTAPPTAAAGDGTGRDVVPDESAILSALRNLNLAPLNRKVKEGWLPRWVQFTGRDGKGWRSQLELPPGVTVEMINDRKTVLAHNLVRLPVEVWPTEPKNQPGVLDLWVADPGILTGPVEPYPLLREGSADYFKGVPVGIDQRGTPVTGKLMACNYAIAGIMGSGKTSLVINLLCGAMLDPLTDIDVYVMAFNADYDPMAPRLRTLVKGDEDTQITAAMDALRALRGEVTERGKMLSDLGGEETKLTRAVAEQYPQMRPTVSVFDECQELFRHERYGEEAKQLAIKVMMKARKTGQTLIWITPAPSADSLPRDLAKTVSHRVCFAIGDHQGNDAILGTGAHRSGITAVDLVPGEDIGTAMASGFANRAGLLRTHHIRKEQGLDEITPIVQRALALREDTGITSSPAAIAAAEADLLADVAAVLGDQSRMRTQEVLQGLVQRNPAAYRGWTFADLRKALPEACKPFKSDGAMKVAADHIRQAITHRDGEAGAEPGPAEPDT